MSDILSLGLAMALAGSAPSGKPYPPLAEVYPQAIANHGDVSRLQRVFQRARSGEKIVVGVIGGSITAGAKASKSEFTWGRQFAAWWEKNFPQSEVVFVNAGIGATGTALAVHRAQRDLLSQRPDVVGVEFSVNDTANAAATETMEGLLRQILSQEQQPAVVMLHTMNSSGGNAQQFHLEVAKHYQVPAISYRDAIWPLIAASKLEWSDLSPDSVHPNDIGHTYCAALINQFLADRLAETPAAATVAINTATLPAPLVGAAFDSGEVIDPGTLEIVSNKGFTLGDADRRWGQPWKANTPGASVSFALDGPTIAMLFWRINGPMGKARISIDGEVVTVVDAWFAQTWGGYTPYQLICKNKPGRHVVTIEVLDEKSPESAGHAFELRAVLRAGMK